MAAINTHAEAASDALATEEASEQVAGLAGEESRQLHLISILLDYPQDELFAAADEVRAACASYPPLQKFVDDLLALDALDAQEHYLSLFDRGRACSLLLFEHVHGQSRDRGQAMVDLMAVYERNGFHIAVRELPDYMPLFLEYLSMRPEAEVREWLGDVSAILQLLHQRLQQRESHYAGLFQALLLMAGVDAAGPELAERVRSEARDDTPESLDAVWEEEMVRFTANAAPECAPPMKPMPSQQVQDPVRWME